MPENIAATNATPPSQAKEVPRSPDFPGSVVIPAKYCGGGQNRIRNVVAEAMYRHFPSYEVKSAGTEARPV